MAKAVPRGTPDPDGDHRFAERPFPLLEPVGWRGERHRGGYGVAEPGSITISLGLVFGPWERGGPEPRLSVNVGDRLVHDMREPGLLWVIAARLGERGRDGTMTTAPITIEGEPVEFRVFTIDNRWIAHGAWRGFSVDVEGANLDPTAVALQLADDVPVDPVF